MVCNKTCLLSYRHDYVILKCHNGYKNWTKSILKIIMKLKSNHQVVRATIISLAALITGNAHADNTLTVVYNNFTEVMSGDNGNTFNTISLSGTLVIDTTTNKLATDTLNASFGGVQLQMFNIGDNVTEQSGIGSSVSDIYDQTPDTLPEIYLNTQGNIANGIVQAIVNPATATNVNFIQDNNEDFGFSANAATTSSLGTFTETTGTTLTAVPLPTSIFTFISGLLGLAALRKKATQA